MNLSPETGAKCEVLFTVNGEAKKVLAHPMERLLELLGPAVQFVYTCWDRIVLNGYLERLQRPENLIYFFHDVVGIACIEPAVLDRVL